MLFSIHSFILLSSYIKRFWARNNFLFFQLVNYGIKSRIHFLTWIFSMCSLLCVYIRKEPKMYINDCEGNISSFFFLLHTFILISLTYHYHYCFTTVTFGSFSQHRRWRFFIFITKGWTNKIALFYVTCLFSLK